MKLDFKVNRRKWDELKANVAGLSQVQSQVEWGPFRGYLEYGTTDGRIPPRPHARPVAQQNRSRWAGTLGGWFRRRTMSPTDLNRTLNKIGTDGVARFKKFISSYVPPANAPATVRKKGFDFPLIETGRYVASIEFKRKK